MHVNIKSTTYSTQDFGNAMHAMHESIHAKEHQHEYTLLTQKEINNFYNLTRTNTRVKNNTHTHTHPHLGDAPLRLIQVLLRALLAQLRLLRLRRDLRGIILRSHKIWHALSPARPPQQRQLTCIGQPFWDNIKRTNWPSTINHASASKTTTTTKSYSTAP